MEIPRSARNDSALKKDRLQKILAQTGIASRRAIESWIKQGRITINGVTAKLGDKVDQCDDIRLDHKKINLQEITKQQTQLLIYHKPVGEVCSHRDDQNRPRVFDQLPKLKNGRWIMVGRLDINTSGLLLFTNDGDLARKLSHPSSGYEREYLVRAHGKYDKKIVDRLKKGVKLQDGFAKFDHIEMTQQKGDNTWFKVIVKEGRNRLVRRLFESQNLLVNRLMRIRFGDIVLPKGLRPGQINLIQSSVIPAKA